VDAPESITPPHQLGMPEADNCHRVPRPAPYLRLYSPVWSSAVGFTVTMPGVNSAKARIRGEDKERSITSRDLQLRSPWVTLYWNVSYRTPPVSFCSSDTVTLPVHVLTANPERTQEAVFPPSSHRPLKRLLITGWMLLLQRSCLVLEGMRTCQLVPTDQRYPQRCRTCLPPPSNSTHSRRNHITGYPLGCMICALG
jgi:hypothetical protein